MWHREEDMARREDIQIHCLTTTRQKVFLEENANTLLELNELHRVRIFSPVETSSIPYEPYLVDVDSGLPHATGSDVGLDVAVIKKHLDTRWVGNLLIYCRETGSTQDVLRKRFAGTIAGTVALTGFQRSGRGRRGAAWVSPSGSVAMSIAVRISRDHPERLTFLQYIAALAAVDAIRAESTWSGADLRIKWPNDVYVNGEKIGGVLCEASFRGEEFHVSVGVGVNITNARPTTCLRDALTHVGEIPAEDHMREVFVGKYLTAFEKVFDEFCEQGFDGRVRERYLSSWMHSGQEIRLGGRDGPRATVHGISSSGAVRVFREDLGAFHDLQPDVSSLDLEEGVLKEKAVVNPSRSVQGGARP